MSVRLTGRQAIMTKYYAPTLHRGARIKVWCEAKTMWSSWDYSASASENHLVAAQRLIGLLAWDGYYVGAVLPDQSGYVFVEVL